jgi:hypothetical protein
LRSGLLLARRVLDYALEVTAPKHPKDIDELIQKYKPPPRFEPEGEPEPLVKPDGMEIEDLLYSRPGGPVMSAESRIWWESHGGLERLAKKLQSRIEEKD